MSCCPHKKFPNALTMAQDFAHTTINAIRHASRTGEIMTEDNLMRKRLEICQECDRRLGTRCQECGCFVSLKVAVKVAKCPIDRW